MYYMYISKLWETILLRQHNKQTQKKETTEKSIIDRQKKSGKTSLSKGENFPMAIYWQVNRSSCDYPMGNSN